MYLNTIWGKSIPMDVTQLCLSLEAKLTDRGAKQSKDNKLWDQTLFLQKGTLVSIKKPLTSDLKDARWAL